MRNDAMMVRWLCNVKLGDMISVNKLKFTKLK